ncbi:GntR family transcriptional regulator [Proteinivorax hydrogeniformans]|uniref:GntR family transcriptional regulator n=1 Tax=Proteinivorax hydrogeniformans TaxID=1826727 RepID=A0AAU8HRM6_9FIRM
MDIIISNTSSQPIYLQISDQIKRQVLRGELDNGYYLPSIRMLAKELQVSVITTKNAYQVLEKEGLIKSVKGRGFYVSAQKEDLLEDMKIKSVEQKLEEVVDEAKELNIPLEKVIEMLKLLY